ncbi:hypothetical protein ACFL6S_06810 [Candidatus Poribacteria bacterium]
MILPILLFAVCAVIVYMQWPRSGVATFKDKFRKSINPAWSPKTADKWELAKEDRKSLYQLKEPGEYDPGVVRPAEYSLISHITYTDFTFKCKLRCDAPVERRYRDLVIIFGYQDDTHFYYVHFSNISDDLHNGIMLVDGDRRRKLNIDVPKPTLTDMDFHKVKVKRDIATGDIAVYFDGKLMMEAQDKTFMVGKVGVGSMDDVGSFDDVYVKGKILVGAP